MNITLDHCNPFMGAAANEPELRQAFIVEIRSEGRIISQRIVTAADWFEAWDAAFDEFGMNARIEVRPV